MALLDALGIEIVYICQYEQCSKEGIDEALSGIPNENTALLFTGGGNLGDIYWTLTEIKMKVLDENPHRRIRYFPQTIKFRSKKRLALAQESFSRHPDFELVGRDTMSCEIMRESFPNNKVRCTPDVAFMIGYNPSFRLTPRQMRFDKPATLSRKIWADRNLTDPVRDLTIITRRDKEGNQDHFKYDWAGAFPDRKVWKIDWLHIGPDLSSINNYPYRQTHATDGTMEWKRYWDEKALLRVEFALDFLSSGRFLIADRLHAHILSTLIGVGHVVVEDGDYAKIGRYQDTWMRGCAAAMPDIDEITQESDENGELLAMEALSGGIEKRGMSLPGRLNDGPAILVKTEEEVIKIINAWFKMYETGIDVSRI